MTATVQIFEIPNKLTIIIKPNPTFVLKFVAWFFYVPTMLSGVAAIYWILFEMNRFYFESLYQLAVGALFVFFARAFLKRIHTREIVTVTSQSLVVESRFLLTRRRSEYKKERVADLKVLGREQFTNHPLDTKGFDYIGLETTEKEAQFLVEDGRVGFKYQGDTVRFGKHVWDEGGELIVKRIEKFWNRTL